MWGRGGRRVPRVGDRPRDAGAPGSAWSKAGRSVQGKSRWAQRWGRADLELPPPPSPREQVRCGRFVRVLGQREGPGGRCTRRAEPSVPGADSSVGCLKRCAGPGAVGCPELCAGAEPVKRGYLWAAGVRGACSGSFPLVLLTGSSGRSPGAQLLGVWVLL